MTPPTMPTMPTMYGECPDCGGNMTHRATDGKCPLRMNTLDMTDEQREELAALVRRAHLRTPEESAPAAGEPFQQRVQPWMLECFGAEIASDRDERSHRFLEESLELVQAAGCTKAEALQLVDYVYGRPIGYLPQEIGGVMVTLAALCLAWSEDMHKEGETELERIWTKVAEIRAKQAAKPKHSPLPAADGGEKCNGACFLGDRCECCNGNGTGRKPADTTRPPPEACIGDGITDLVSAQLAAEQDSKPADGVSEAIPDRTFETLLSKLRIQFAQMKDYQHTSISHGEIKALFAGIERLRASRPAMTGEQREALELGAESLRKRRASVERDTTAGGEYLRGLYDRCAATLEAMAKERQA